jgi:predicted phosphodiesterase
MRRLIHQVKRRLRLLTAVAVLLSLASTALGLQIVKGPYLQNVTKTGITVLWETDLPSDSHVDYGETDQYGKVKGSADPVTLHEMVIDDLWADSLFHYKVRSTDGVGQVESEDNTFQTAVLEGTPFKFCHYSDNQGGWPRHKIICDLIRSKSPRFVVHSGDMVQDGYNYDEWGTYFFDPARNLIKQVAIFTIPGNHERQHDYYTYFMSNPTESSGTEWYYSFDYGNTHFCMINSNDTAYGYGNDMTYYPGTPQYDWIVSDLSSTQQEWKIVVLHHPPYSSGLHGCHDMPKSREYLCPLFAKYGVDLVISGHDHLYERTVAMRGVPYIVSAGGGGYLTDETCDHWWTVKLVVEYHYSIFTVDGKDLKMEVRNINDQVIDTFRLSHSPAQFAQEKKQQVPPQGPDH